MAAGFPTKLMWFKEIQQDFYASWPSLTIQVVHKHFPESEDNIKGHTRKTKSGLKSTRPMEEPPSDGEEDQEMPKKKTKNIFVKVYDLNEDPQEKMYTSQTG